MAVARAWARPGARGGSKADSDDPHADAIAAHLAARKTQQPAEGLLIYKDEQDVVSLFLSLQTAWRWHPLAGVRLGLDYAMIAPVAAAIGLSLAPAIFTDLQVMEAEALKELGRKA